MKLEHIELYHVAMPLIEPWRTAYGEDEAVHSVLCRMVAGGVEGWGESSPLAAPCYSPEWAGGIFAVNRDWFAPAVLGLRVSEPASLASEVQERLSLFKGNPFAKAVLDTAAWSLASRLSGKPLHVLLGTVAATLRVAEIPTRSVETTVGAVRNEVPVGADFGVTDDLDALLSNVGRAVDEGFARVKLKYRPGWDLPMLEAVRRQFPEHPLHIDCNAGYRLGDLPMFRELDRFNLSMIEQPLQHDDLLDHAELQKQIETPVCLDESISGPRQAEQAVSLGSCRFINVKPGRVGGLTNAVAIHNVCRDANVPCWVGGMLESATGAAFCIALGMLSNFTYPADIFPSTRFYHEDLSDPPIELHRSEEGHPSVRALEQLPCPVPERLEKLTVQRAVLRA